MLPRHHPGRLRIAFNDHRLVTNAGLVLPATLALRLGLPELVQQRLNLGDAPGRANTGDKMMTLVASVLAGGDCIDDADALRAGGTACTLGGWGAPRCLPRREHPRGPGLYYRPSTFRSRPIEWENTVHAGTGSRPSTSTSRAAGSRSGSGTTR